MNTIEMTREGYEKLQGKYQILTTVKRKEIASDLKEAMSYGDLSENAEYDIARANQAELEKEILIIGDKLSRTVVVDENEINTSSVSIGVKVKVLDELNNEVEYKIVGSGEADLDNFKISKDSPVGASLLNHSAGEKVNIRVPNGIVEYEILEISL